MAKKVLLGLVFFTFLFAPILSVFAGGQKEVVEEGLSFEGVTYGETTLNVLAIAGPRFGGVTESLGKDFTKEHPNVLVKVNALPYDQFVVKLTMDVAVGGKDYDVVWLDYYLLPGFANSGYLLLLEPLLKQHADYWKDLNGDVPPAVTNLYKWKGQQYGIPADGNTALFFYRKDILDKVGVDIPETSEDFLEAAKNINNPPEIYGVAWHASSGYWAADAYEQPFLALGGQYLDSETFMPGFDTPEAREALEWFIEVVKYAPPEIYEWGWAEMAQGLGTASLAAMAPAVWGDSMFMYPGELKYADQIEAAEPPSFHGKRRGGMAGLGLAINARIPKSKQLAAFDFIRYLSAKENGNKYVEYGGQPARTSILSDPQYREGPRRYYTALSKAIAYAVPRPGIPEIRTVHELLGLEVVNVMTKKKTVDQGLKDAQQGVYDYLVSTGRIK